MSKKTLIVLVGAPCSGKSSAGKLTAKKLNAKYISSGDIARQMAERDSMIRDKLNEGNLAPEIEMRTMIAHNMDITSRDIVILDGFPRFGDQAQWLHEKFSDRFEIKYVLFYIPLSTIIERSMNRNREDDKSIENRIRYYYNVTYKELSHNIDVTINANENTIEDCFRLLTDYIKEVVGC